MGVCVQGQVPVRRPGERRPRCAPGCVCGVGVWGRGGGGGLACSPSPSHAHAHTHTPSPPLPPPPSLLLQLWVPACDQTIIALVFYHLMMVGLLGLKKSIGAPIFVAILLFFDLMFV